MALVVTVGRIGFDKEGVTYQEDIIGPFRDEDRAHRKRDGIERALKNAGLEDKWEARVEYVWPGTETIRDIIDSIKGKEEVRARS